jgi:hypothetical protein
MTSTEKGGLNSGLSLEPIDGVVAPTGKAVFHPNTRDKSERRNGDTRREEVRLQEPRRKQTRRPKTAWTPETTK